jgi:hypothetical protein
VLASHSYGGAVVSVAAADTSRGKALVHIAAFVPDIGESALELTAKYPGITLTQATSTQCYPLPGGGQGEELIIKQRPFGSSSRPECLPRPLRSWPWGSVPSPWPRWQEQSTAAAWKKLPSWCLVATEDRNIPPSGVA